MFRLLKKTLKVPDCDLASVPIRDRRRQTSKVRAWIYRFGLRSAVYDMRQDSSNHKTISTLRRIPKGSLQLKAVNYDSIAACLLLRLLTAPRVNWSC